MRETSGGHEDWTLSEMVRLIFLVETCWFPSSVLKMKTEKLISKFLSLYGSTRGVTFDKTVFVIVNAFPKNEVATGNTRRYRDSSVGITTHYGLDGQEIESRCGRDFPHPSTPALWPTQPAIQWVPGLCLGKAAGGWRRPPTPI